MKQTGLNSNQLKLIAIVAMTVDHLAWTLFPGYDTRWFVLLAHMIGRLTAPIMWFFLAEGYHHTRNLKRYALRLFSLAVISHFAYNFCFGIPLIPFRTGIFNQTGVVWSLAWGLVLLWIFDKSHWKQWQQTAAMIGICILTFPCDWSCIAALAVAFMGANRGNFLRQMQWMMVWTAVYALVYFLFLDRFYGVVQLFTCLCIPVLKHYNGQRGCWKGMGMLFYAYYPVHLAVLGILRILLWGTDFATAAGSL